MNSLENIIKYLALALAASLVLLTLLSALLFSILFISSVREIREDRKPGNCEMFCERK